MKRKASYQLQGVGRHGPTIRRTLTQAGTAALIRALPPQYQLPAKGAMWAAGRIKSSFKNYRLRKQVAARVAQKKSLNKYRPFRGVSTASYAGKFRKARKHRVTKVDMYQSKGSGSSIENHGKVADPDCIYVGHSTLCRDEIVRVMLRSILRKLLVGGIGFDADSYDQEIPYNAYNEGTKYMLMKWIWIETDGVTNVNSYTFPTNNATINSVTTALMGSGGLGAQLVAAMSGQGFEQLERVSLYTAETPDHQLAFEMNMKNHIVDLLFKSSLKIQNRTKAAESGSSSTDVIDNQPVVGYRYVGTGACPRTKQMFFASQLVDRHGVYLNTAAQLNATAPVAGPLQATEFKEPLNPKIFSNVYRSSRISLQPGQIKKGFISYTLKGYFNNILRRLQVREKTTGNQQLVSGPGKFEIYSFEEVINTGITNPITIQYEQQLDIYCKFIKGKTPVILNKYNENVVDLLPA